MKIVKKAQYSGSNLKWLYPQETRFLAIVRKAKTTFSKDKGEWRGLFFKLEVIPLGVKEGKSLIFSDESLTETDKKFKFANLSIPKTIKDSKGVECDWKEKYPKLADILEKSFEKWEQTLEGNITLQRNRLDFNELENEALIVDGKLGQEEPVSIKTPNGFKEIAFKRLVAVSTIRSASPSEMAEYNDDIENPLDDDGNPTKDKGVDWND